MSSRMIAAFRYGTTLVAVSLLATACSSGGGDETAGPAPAAVAVDAGGNPLPGGATTPAGAAAAAATPAADAGAAAATATPSAGGGASPAGAPATPSRPSGFGDLKMGHGISAETITVGVQYADASAYNAAATALGGTSGFNEVDDPKGIQNSVIEYFNANGGIAGRAIEPVWHEVTAQNAVTKEGRARDAQGACATYTEDNDVFAIMGSGQWTEQNIIDCAINSDSPYIDGMTAATGTWASQQQVEKFGRHYYTLSMLTTNRREQAMLTSLQRLGFFEKGAKVGILVEDSVAFHHASDRVLKPALEKLGVPYVEVAYPDIIESPWQNYVLRMQSDGVTHVYFTASTAEGWPTLLFMRGAENQAYRPAYAISGMPLDWLENNAPDAQLEKAMGVTWLPSRVEGVDRPPTSERDAICREVVKAKGYPETAGLPWCDFFWFLKDALERAPELTSAGLQAAAEQLGDGWMSALTFGGRTRFAPGRHDGAYTFRDFRYDAGTGQFTYASELYEVP